MIAQPPNKALQLTVNPLRGLSAAELGRYLLGKQYLKWARSQHDCIDSVEAEKSGVTGFEKT